MVTDNVFTSSGTFTPPAGVTSVDVLVVAGGGGGGRTSNSGGGGGAGGVVYSTGVAVTPGVGVTVTVGAGAAAQTVAGTIGNSGGDSSFGAVSATGGGGGGVNGGAGAAGGSGGGGSGGAAGANGAGGAGTGGQGGNGGTGFGSGTTNNRACGGGGGAGGVGSNATSGVGGQGGAGVDYSATFGTGVGASGWFASGGGGGSRTTQGSSGGSGGGGAGGGGNAAANTGGGGGGSTSVSNGGAGGSGVVIVRYTAGAATVNGGQATEADSALAGTTTAGARISGGLAVVTHAALAGVVAAGALVTGGQATQSEVALPGSVTVHTVVSGGQAVETDAARAGSVITGLAVLGGLAEESDSALAGSVLVGYVIAGGVALESDSALAGSAAAGVLVAGGLAEESDSAFAGSVAVEEPDLDTVVAGGQAVELDSALRGRLTYSYGVPDRGNRANGLELTGSLPLTFDPVVDPAPARAAKRRVVKGAAFTDVDVSGTVASYTVDVAARRRLRQRVVIGGKDATYIYGAETTITWQLVSPLLYGPATATVPGVKTPFRIVGKGSLRWMKKGATVRVDLVNDDDHVVERGIYKGLVQAWNIDGTDVTLQIGGEASGRAAMRRKPLPVYDSYRPVGNLAWSLIRNLGLDFKPFQGPDSPATIVPKLGGMWHIEALEHLCKISQRRNGTQFSIMPGNDGAYRFEAKDTTTIHATVYVDGARVKANVRSDMAEEPNRVYVNSVTSEGRRLTGIVSPGIIQGDPPPWGGSPLSVGDTGGQVPVLVQRLRASDLLTRTAGVAVFDEDVAEAVEDLQDMAGLPATGVVNEATWNALWDLNVVGYSLEYAHREPAAQRSRVAPWLTTPSGALIARNPDYDPQAPKVDAEEDLGSGVDARTRRRVARSKLQDAQTDNWVGTIEVPMGAVIEGEHNPGDPLGPSNLMDFRLLKPGMNLWCPGFQDEVGTLFHITGVDVGSLTLQVDTRARDTLEVDDVIRRNRDERRWRRGRRASIETKDVVGEWDGAAGGELYQDIPIASGRWNVFAVAAGGEGTISRLRIHMATEAEFCMAIFGGTRRVDALASALDRRMGDPFTEDGYANWDDRDKRPWLRENGLLYMAGSPDDPCGYDPRAKSRGGEITGEWNDEAGIAYRTDKFPILYVAVWSPTDTTIPAGRIMWNQLEPGA